MRTFRFKLWRFSWLTYPSWGWGVTVIDGSGRWRKVFGPLCFLVERDTSHDNQYAANEEMSNGRM